MTVVAVLSAVLLAWNEWCLSHQDQWCWGLKHGSTCHRLYQVRCCYQCSDGLQSWPTWHSIQSHFSCTKIQNISRFKFFMVYEEDMTWLHVDTNIILMMLLKIPLTSLLCTLVSEIIISILNQGQFSNTLFDNCMQRSPAHGLTSRKT